MQRLGALRWKVITVPRTSEISFPIMRYRSHIGPYRFELDPKNRAKLRYKITTITHRVYIHIYVYVYSSNKTIKLSVRVLRNSWKQKLYRSKRYTKANEDESISSVLFLRKE